MDTLNPVAGAASQPNGHTNWSRATAHSAARLKPDHTRTDNPNGFVSIARGGLLGAAPLGPLVAAAIALALYVHPLDFIWTPPSLLAGVIDLLLAWCLVAAAYAALGFTDVRRANATTYCELENALTELEAMAEDAEDGPEHPSAGRRARACKQFAAYETQAKGALDGRLWSRSTWVQGTGYVSAWRLLHRAQEVLIGLEPSEGLIERATYDLQRLAGSTIETRALLGERLAQAIDVLRPYALHVDHVLEPATSAAAAPPAATAPIVATTTAPSSSFGVPPAPRTAADARLLVGTVRATLNEYRDKSREGLVRARNRLACTTVSTGVIAYIVLWLAIGARIRIQPELFSAIAYFLVGALTGLFARQYAEFGSDTATDDFGLSNMRLFAAPQLSGVAAVFGVALLTLADRAMQGSGGGGLEAAFNVQQAPVNLVAAAMFGLTPGLLIDRLKQQTDGLRSNLRKTEPQEAPAPTT